MRIRRCIQALSTLLLMFLVISSSFAQDRNSGSVKVGEADLYPSVRFDFVSSDNAFLTSSDLIDTNGFLVKPKLELVANRRLLDISLAYEGDYGSFNEDVLNYDDHRLSFLAGADLATRHRVTGSLSFDLDHEEFGLNFTRGQPVDGSELVEFFTVVVQAGHIYGAANARGNLETGITIQNRDFLSQESLTDGFGFTEVSPSVAFTYRLSSSARALLGIDYSAFSFEDSSRDRDEVSVFAGVRLAEGRKTSGSVRLGVGNSDFSDGREDLTVLNAEIGLVYRPVSFSQITLDFDRALANLDGVATATDQGESIQDIVQLQWIHQWSSRVSSRAFLNYSDLSRDCPDEDTVLSRVGFEFGISVRRSVTVGASVDQTDRSDSECPNIVVDGTADSDFSALRFGVFLEAKL